MFLIFYDRTNDTKRLSVFSFAIFDQFGNIVRHTPPNSIGNDKEFVVFTKSLINAIWFS